MMWVRTFFAGLVTLLLVNSAPAQEPIRFARTPDISPDGKLVAFSYLGDIWVVEAIGGVARPVTQHAAHHVRPVVGPDRRGAGGRPDCRSATPRTFASGPTARPWPSPAARAPGTARATAGRPTTTYT